MKNTLLFATLSPTCMIVKFAKKNNRAFSSPPNCLIFFKWLHQKKFRIKSVGSHASHEGIR